MTTKLQVIYEPKGPAREYAALADFIKEWRTKITTTTAMSR